MKTWENAEIEVLSFEETQNGGMPSMKFDQSWFDENDALHVNFES